MSAVYRSNVRVGACTTLAEKSVELGGSHMMLQSHKLRGTVGFPEEVARFGNAVLYVEAELDAFYNSVQWRQANRSVKELTGEQSWDNS